MTTVATWWSLYQELPVLISKSDQGQPTHIQGCSLFATRSLNISNYQSQSKYQVQICQMHLTSIQPCLSPQGQPFIVLPVHHFLMADLLLQHLASNLEDSRSPGSLEKPLLVSKETALLGFYNPLLRWAPTGPASLPCPMVICIFRFLILKSKHSESRTLSS
jgi:hypothetical protein